MPTTRSAYRTLIIAALTLSSVSVVAEPIDDLARCYVEKTSEADQQALARWMFAALAQHGGMAKFATVSEKDLEQVTNDAAAIMQRLVTSDCVEPARTAAAEQGLGAVSQALQVLGQVASRALLTDAKVGQSMNAVNTKMDEEKILAAVDPDGKIRAAEKAEAESAGSQAE
jgi:hypothetical protein